MSAVELSTTQKMASRAIMPASPAAARRKPRRAPVSVESTRYTLPGSRTTKRARMTTPRMKGSQVIPASDGEVAQAAEHLQPPLIFDDRLNLLGCE